MDEWIPAHRLREDGLRGNDEARVGAVVPARTGFRGDLTEHECGDAHLAAAFPPDGAEIR